MTGPRILLLPGWQNSDPSHWQSRWESIHGDQRVEQHDWMRPLRGDWSARLEEAVLALNARYFRFDLSGLADFQYALYGGPEGGHFDWHKDYGRDREGRAWEPRKVTLSLQLSDGADYDGCDLEVRAGNQIDTAPRVRGTLVAFPSNVLHRVTPITRGIRKSLVIWAVGPEFR